MKSTLVQILILIGLICMPILSYGEEFPSYDEKLASSLEESNGFTVSLRKINNDSEKLARNDESPRKASEKNDGMTVTLHIAKGR